MFFFHNSVLHFMYFGAYIFGKCNEYYLNNTTFQTMCVQIIIEALQIDSSVNDFRTIFWFWYFGSNLYLFTVFHISYFVNRKFYIENGKTIIKKEEKDVCYSV